MMWTVAARYGFGESEMWGLPISRLRFWYEGCEHMHSEEKQQMNTATGG